MLQALSLGALDSPRVRQLIKALEGIGPGLVGPSTSDGERRQARACVVWASSRST